MFFVDLDKHWHVTFANAIETACSTTHNQMRAKGFHAQHDNLHAAGFGVASDIVQVGLQMTELAECIEAIRKPGPSEHIPDFSGVAEEQADAVIRIFDFCGRNNIPLGQAIIAKMRFNHDRAFMHGKKA